MNILAILQMGDSNSRYHLEALVRSPKVNRLIIARSHPIPKLSSEKIKYISFSRPATSIILFLKLFFILMYEIYRNKIDFIVSFFAFPYGLLAKLMSIIYSIPCHIGFVGSDVNNYISDFRFNFLFRFLSGSAVVTTTGNDMRNKLLEIGFDQNKIYILPNSVPTEEINKNQPGKSHYDLIFVGSLNKVKNVSLVINAAGEATRISGLRIKLCIVGDGPLIENLKKLASCQPDKCSIDFMGFQQNPYEYYYNGKIFTMASRNEGLPFSLLEAMCAGLVPVVTPVGSIKEIIKQGENGFLFEIDDYVSAARYYVKLITDFDLYCEMRNKALEIRNFYSIEKALEIWNLIIESIFKEKEK